jgi:hypothetical protein
VDVLLGVHSPRIDIEVRIYFDRRDVLARQHNAQHASSCTLILRPIVLSSRPVEEAVARVVSSMHV